MGRNFTDSQQIVQNPQQKWKTVQRTLPQPPRQRNQAREVVAGRVGTAHGNAGADWQ